MDNKKILVLGGNGFIGCSLLKFLITQKNLDLYSFDLDYPEHPASTKIRYIKGDFFDDDCLKRVVAGMDIIVHCLCTLNPGNSNTCYMQGYQKDFLQTIKLCELIISQKATMLFLSSGGTVYGSQLMQPIPENALPLPINHYGSMKLCTETVIKCFNKQLHSKMKIARIANPYGPGQDYSKGVGFIDAVLKCALNNENIEIWGTGEIVRDYIYIDDLCEMLWTLMEYEGDETIFNIGSGIGVSQKEILTLVGELGLPINILFKEERSVDVDCIILDNSKIQTIYKKELLSLKDGLKTYLEYLYSLKH